MEYNGIKYFIGCGVPVNVCNFRCGYCYLGQHPHPYEGGIIPFIRTSKYISEYFSIKKMGGPCYFNFCGNGETLLHPEIIELVIRLIKEGHYCDIITNGTLSKKFDEIVSNIEPEFGAHLLIKFSFHYIELKRKGLLEKFVDNVNKMRDNGISYSVEITPYDDLIPYIDEIKNFSIKNFGAFPHFTVARNEETKNIELLTSLSSDEYKNTWSSFNSPMFDFKSNIFGVKRNEFCYAGLWSIQLNLATGNYSQCYGGDVLGTITDFDKPINFRAIGKCRQPHCFNGHAYLTYGVIPELSTPMYVDMRDRISDDERHWLQPETIRFFSTKLSESHPKLTKKQKKNILRMRNLYKGYTLFIRGKSFFERKINKRRNNSFE